MNETQRFTTRIKALVAKHDLKEALRQLRLLLENSPALEEALQQEERFRDIRRQIRLGLVDEEQANLLHNQISAGIVELLRELESPEGIQPAVRAEVEQAAGVVNSKNVVVDSTLTAGRDLNIGDKHFHYYGERKIDRALTPNPFQAEYFLGREADLLRIRDKLFSGDHFLLLVNGVGGVGKTTLASRYYQTYQDEYAHTAWVLSEKNIANALLLLAAPLGLRFHEQMNADERLEILLKALAGLRKPCLLVIDNANESDDLEANYQKLRRCSNFHLLLTTRITTFANAETYQIEGLPEAEALQLFKKYYPKFQPEKELAIFKEIRAAVGGNTLVMELLAKNLALFNKLKTHYALTDLLADLQQKGVLGLSQSQEVLTDYQTKSGAMRKEKPEAIIAAMYDLGELPVEEQALLAVFAVLPAESIGFETLERLLPGLENLETGLLALAHKGWIEYNETETAFKCSPVVQEVTKVKSPDLAATCRPLIEALNQELAREVLHIDNYKHSSLFARYAETVIISLSTADDDLGTLSQNIGNFHIETGDLSKAIWAYQKMADIQSALFLENPDDPEFKNGLAISYSKLGSTQSSLGNLEQALTYFEDETKLFEELYEAYPQNVSFKNGLALSHQWLGWFYEDKLQNIDKAKEHYRQSKALLAELVLISQSIWNLKRIWTGWKVSFSERDAICCCCQKRVSVRTVFCVFCIVRDVPVAHHIALLCSELMQLSTFSSTFTFNKNNGKRTQLIGNQGAFPKRMGATRQPGIR